MYIERVQVEAEGFLSGLDLEFSPSLNVIIGARGTGKTSLIELIRFCLQAGAFTEDAGNRGEQQAMAILAGGAVTVTMNDRGSRFTITRSADGRVTTTSTVPYSCTVLAQNEVEAVGAQASGRLHLIDRFRMDRESAQRSVLSLQSRVLSLTVELRSILQDGLGLSDQVESLSYVPEQLADALALQRELLAAAKATEEDRSQLAGLQNAGQLAALREAIITQSLTQVAAFSSRLISLSDSTAGLLQRWPADAGEDVLRDSRETADLLRNLLDSANSQVSVLQQKVRNAQEANETTKADIDAKSRLLRQSLESLQEGIGAATRSVAHLEELKGQIAALESGLNDRRRRFQEVASIRDSAYESMDRLRDKIFADRSSVAQDLNTQLGPSIRVRLTRSEDKSGYRSSLVAALRGSGLHYNAITPLIANNISPYELATWVEQGTSDELASALSLSPDRALSIVSALRSTGVAEIISSSIEDGVSLELLDGREYKPTDHLSIGQRCTVVLPVLLGRHGDPLIVDQPEDHLDNSFIASTLVAALNRREPHDQLIFSSHNANIPVLGNAERIVVMHADGDRGYVSHAGSLDSPPIVDAVTRIMEGGTEAFNTRAAFYGHQVRDEL